MLSDHIARRVAVLGSARIPFCRSHTAYRHESNQEMMTAALRGLVSRYDLTGQQLGDVVLGAVIKHSRDFNLARESVLDSGLSRRTPGLDLQRACGTSLEAVFNVGNKIALGQMDSGIGGGVDSISDAPIVFSDEYRRILFDAHGARSLLGRIKPFFRIRPRHFKPEFPGVAEPRTGLSMGESTELTAKEWKVSREHQDQLALASHVKAAKAYDAGWYEDLVVPYNDVLRDNNIRPDSTIEKLRVLKPVFDRESGTMTAGNSTPLTDGAAAVLLGSEQWAAKKQMKPLAYLTHTKIAAVNFIDDEGLLMAPAYAVSELLKDVGLELQDFDFYEIHEAFAAQAIATLMAWQSDEFCKQRLGRTKAMGPIDLKRMNVKGGSIAMGHPFAATGARIVGTMAKLLSEKGSGRGLISVCTAGGMGVAAIMEAAPQ